MTKSSNNPGLLLPPEDARVLVFSQRNVNRLMYQCFMYEFEDVVRAIDRVDLLAPVPVYSTEAGQLAHRVSNTIRKSAGMLPVGDIEPIRIERNYDLLFAVFQFPHQAIYLNQLKGWRKRCRKAACFLAEVWTPTIRKSKEYLSLLKDVDHVFTHSEVSARALSELLGRRCHFLPFGVDAERFCPLPSCRERSIDVLSVGRYSPGAHQALLRLAAEQGLFYHFDTARNFQVKDYMEHRTMLADLLKRARFFLTYKHNVNISHITGGDEALGPRFFEGAASGAVMLGLPPDCNDYRSCFDWEDAIIEVPYDPANIETVLAELSAQPERLAAARVSNVVQALTRHDWAHRWATILAAAGLAGEPGMDARFNRMARLAATVQDALAASPGTGHRTGKTPDRRHPGPPLPARVSTLTG